MSGTRVFLAGTLLAAVTAASACTESVGRGAAVGAAAGAGLGALHGGGLVRNAATGAVVGAAGGYVYDWDKARDCGRV